MVPVWYGGAGIEVVTGAGVGGGVGGSGVETKPVSYAELGASALEENDGGNDGTGGGNDGIDGIGGRWVSKTVPGALTGPEPNRGS